MTNEDRKLEAKKREWVEELREWNKQKRKWWRGFLKEMKKAFDWLFFYKAEDDGDKALHILYVISVDLIILRAFGII
jgi:hypothetical protein